MAMMEHEDISNENLAGHLLVSAPYLDGGGFYHSVIFLSRVEEEFVIGHILNHPAGMNVGEVARHTDIPESPLPRSHLQGRGPVERNQLIFAAFVRTGGQIARPVPSTETGPFEDPHAILRAYVGQRLDALPAAPGAERPRQVRLPHRAGHLPGAGLLQGMGHAAPLPCTTS